ncbi:hypothetical protein HOY82DRAFT_638875 [Tuber indicum]|nr:hypothetical protein HOY82DRAFT_638875 [Tuber indicum]
MDGTAALDDYLANHEKASLLIGFSPLSPTSLSSRRQCKDWVLGIVFAAQFPILLIMTYAVPTKPAESIIPVSVLWAFGATYLLSGIYCVGAERPLEGLSLIVFGGLNMGLEHCFSAVKSGSGTGLPAVMLDMLVGPGMTDLGIFTTVAIGALAVLQGWLWMVCTAGYLGVLDHVESSGEKVVWLLFSFYIQLAVYTLSAYWVSGVISNISTYPTTITPQSPTLSQPSKPSRALSQKSDPSPSARSGPASVYMTRALQQYTGGGGVAPLLTKSTSIDSCLDSVTALVSFTTVMLVYIYVYPVPPSFFENKAHISALLVFAVWIGFQVSALCTIPLRSGTATIFTILASNPVAFKRDFPAQYYKILKTSPGIEIGGV